MREMIACCIDERDAVKKGQTIALYLCHLGAEREKIKLQQVRA